MIRDQNKKKNMLVLSTESGLFAFRRAAPQHPPAGQQGGTAPTYCLLPLLDPSAVTSADALAGLAAVVHGKAVVVELARFLQASTQLQPAALVQVRCGAARGGAVWCNGGCCTLVYIICMH